MADRTQELVIAEAISDGFIFDGDLYAGMTGNVLIGMIGKAPDNPPYLAVRLSTTGPGPTYIASISNKNSLRALAHRILRAIGDE